MPRYNHETDRDELTTNEKMFLLGVAGVVGAILLIVLFVLFTQRVTAGNACVVTQGGKITGEAGPGIHMTWPGYTKFRCFNTRLQTVDSTALDPISGKTNEGIDFTVSLIVQYTIPRDNVRFIYESNARDDGLVRQNIVELHVRALAPNMLNVYSADQLYVGDLRGISDSVGAELRTRFADRGIQLEYFEIRRGDFDDTYEQAIRDKAMKTEQAKQKVIEQQLATAEAERLRIEAEGRRAAAVIDAQAKAESAIIAAEADAAKVQLDADATTYANNTIGGSLANNPALLEYERIKAIQSANVIYLPSDTGVLPILPLEAAP